MGKYYSLYNNAKLRKGGRKIAKLSEKQFGEKAKKFILDTCKADSWTIDKMNKTDSASKIISSLPRAIRTIYYNDKKGDTIIKKDFKGIQPDWENHDITGGLRTVKNCPYIIMMVGGDWECPLCVMIYHDGKQFRCYIPEKGNAYRKDTKRLFGNCDANYDSKTETYTDEWKKNGTTYISDDKYAFDELVKEGILDKEKDKNKLRSLGRNIEFDTKKCIEDFTARVEPISIKESYHRISSNDLKMIYESMLDNIEFDNLTNILRKELLKQNKNITFDVSLYDETIRQYLIKEVAGQFIEYYIYQCLNNKKIQIKNVDDLLEDIVIFHFGKNDTFDFGLYIGEDKSIFLEVKAYNNNVSNIAFSEKQKNVIQHETDINLYFLFVNYDIVNNGITIKNVYIVDREDLQFTVKPNVKKYHITNNILNNSKDIMR